MFAYYQPDGTWHINNTGFITGRTSVISIDACSTERRTRAFLDRIASVTSAPVTTLVNTHHHGDHTYGNSVFGAVTIVGHENCRTELIAYGPPANAGIWEPVDWGQVTLAPPTLTFFDRLRLFRRSSDRGEPRRSARAHHERQPCVAARAAGPVLRRPAVQRWHAVHAHGLDPRGD